MNIVFRWLLPILLLATATLAHADGPSQPPGPQPTTCPGGSAATAYTAYGQTITCGVATATGTINNGASPQIGQYAGANTIGPATISGDATLAAGGALTVSKINGISIVLGGSFTTTGTGAVTFAFPSVTAVYTLPTTTKTLMASDFSNAVNGTVTNALLQNDTISGTALGGNLAALTFGTHVTGTSYNGSSNVTIATDATSANTASTIVSRDASGNFAAGTITASLTGHSSLDLLLTGGTLTGELVTAASGTGGAGFNLPPGSAPTSPNNGDVWVTSAGLFVRVVGVTVGPLGTGGGSSLTVTDGTHTVTNVATLTFSGCTISGSGGSVTATCTGGLSTITEGSTPTSGFTTGYLMVGNAGGTNTPGQVAPNAASLAVTAMTSTSGGTVGNVGGQESFNNTGLTATLPNTSSLGAGQTVFLVNQNSSALTIANGGQTINGGMASATSLHQYGFMSVIGNSAGGLDLWGFPGYGTITTNALGKFLDGTGAMTASSIVDNGSGVTVGSPTGGAQGAGTVNAANLYVNGVAVTAGGISTVTDGTNTQTGATTLSLGTGLQTTNGSTGTAPIALVEVLNTQSTNSAYAIQATDGAKTILRTNSVAASDTIPVATTSGFGAGFGVTYDTTSVAGNTITPTTSTINGLASELLGANQGVNVTSDGTNYHAILGVPQPATQTGTTYLRDDMTWHTPSGSGSGTVNSGTTGQLGYYAANGTTISGESGSAFLDATFGNTQGNILVRTGSSWTVLAPPGSGGVYTLQIAGGSGNTPYWNAAALACSNLSANFNSTGAGSVAQAECNSALVPLIIQ